MTPDAANSSPAWRLWPSVQTLVDRTQYRRLRLDTSVWLRHRAVMKGCQGPERAAAAFNLILVCPDMERIVRAFLANVEAHRICAIADVENKSNQAINEVAHARTRAIRDVRPAHDRIAGNTREHLRPYVEQLHATQEHFSDELRRAGYDV